ncbi:MAG TPA: lysophospholipid acyltransferase family protein [Pseudonocardiaceae bacterium]
MTGRDNEAPRGALARVLLLRRTPRTGRGRWFGIAIDLIWPLIMVCTRPVWRGRAHVPPEGAVLIAANHLSYVDPVTLTAYLLSAGRVPRYLAKAELWRNRLVGKVMSDGGHVPVERSPGRGTTSYREALRLLTTGECVVVFPEGTFTDDPDGWPMAGQAGVARMALRTGAPVVPMAHWGGESFLPPGSTLPRLFPRRTVTIVTGPPVDLDDLRGGRITPEVLATATKRIMAAITVLLAEIRQQEPPAHAPYPQPDPEPQPESRPEPSGPSGP